MQSRFSWATRHKLRKDSKPCLQQRVSSLVTDEKLNRSPKSQVSEPDYPVFASLLGECAREQTLHIGRKLHCLVICSSHDKKVLLGNLLIKMYDACGQFMDARSIFHCMQSRNIITWTLFMNAYIHHGDHSGAINCYREMHVAGVKPNNVTLVSILSATSLDQGMTVHACVVEYGFDAVAILETALINMYRKFGCLENVRWLFDRMDSRDVVAWNTLIVAYVQHGKLHDSIQVYLQMRWHEVEPNLVTFKTLLGACCNSGTILQGLIMHTSIMEAGLESDVAIGSDLVTMYSKIGNIEEAQKVFNKLKPGKVIMWNAMIMAHVESGHHSLALSLYEEMRAHKKVPNHFTFITVLSACTMLPSILYGMVVHATAVRQNLESQYHLATALLSLYGKCGSVRSARKVFDKLPSRDQVTWNAMLSVYVLNEHEDEAFQLYHKMLRNCMMLDRFTFNTLLTACHCRFFIPQGQLLHNDIIIYGVERQAGIGVNLIGMYSKCGSIEGARSVFYQQDMQDLELWNIMLSAYVQSDLGEKALLLFIRMGKEGVKPDEFTYSAVVAACSDLAAFGQGKVLHAAAVDGGLDSDFAVQNALVHMYCKCGTINDAWSVFKNHPDQDIISWNALVSGYAEHGDMYEALHVFGRMQRQNVKANKVTFVGVFVACAHVGLLEEGLEYFGSMREDYGILPDLEHYASIVDLFGRVGRLQEAENSVHHFPIQPDVVVWKALLGSCGVHNNKCRARVAAEHAVELELENTLCYVLLSNIYAAYEELDRI
ncbi:hypothetical protein L7F22_055267 [Adiantum nelumboides]|nr:hypothetical protein [Adiantum nelumboides]